MMLAHVYLKKGAIVPRHSHENEQLTYILEGALRFWIGEDESETVDVRAGEVLHIPSHVPQKLKRLKIRSMWIFSAHRVKIGLIKATII